MSTTPSVFLSYARQDAEDDRGRLLQLIEDLEREIRLQLGKDFRIFWDNEAIPFGEPWRQEIDRALARCAVLIAIVTPRYLRSHQCRRELKVLFARADAHVLPIEYVLTPALEARGVDSLADDVADLQRADWRELRLRPAADMQRELHDVAARVVERLRGGSPPRTPATPEGEAPGARPPRIELPELPSPQVPSFEPRTLVVAADGSGEFTSVSAALTQAGAGDRVLVRPGRYRESLLVDRPVELIGEGDLADILIEADRGIPLTWRARMGRVANLSFHQRGADAASAVLVQSGLLDLDGCSIEADEGAGVLVTGRAAPRIRSCVLRRCQFGVLVAVDAAGTIEACDFREIRAVDVWLSDRSRAEVRGNLVRGGGGIGILVERQARPSLEGNDVHGHEESELTIADHASPTVRWNFVHHGRVVGVQFFDDTSGTFEDNRVFEHQGTAMVVLDRARPLIRGNRVYRCARGGLSVKGEARPSVEDNEMFDNRMTAVEVSERARPLIRANTLRDNGEGGLFLFGDSRAIVQSNEISGNELVGLEARDNAAPEVRANRVLRNRMGLHLHEHAAGAFESNQIIGNGGPGLLVQDHARPTVVDNVVTGNGVGVVVGPHTGGRYEGNDLRNNEDGAWTGKPGLALGRRDNRE